MKMIPEDIEVIENVKINLDKTTEQYRRVMRLLTLLKSDYITFREKLLLEESLLYFVFNAIYYINSSEKYYGIPFFY